MMLKSVVKALENPRRLAAEERNKLTSIAEGSFWLLRGEKTEEQGNREATDGMVQGRDDASWASPGEG